MEWRFRSQAVSADILALKQEFARLNKVLKRATEERDALKKPPCTLPARVKYTFIDQHQSQFKISGMWDVLKVHRSGY